MFYLLCPRFDLVNSCRNKLSALHVVWIH